MFHGFSIEYNEDNDERKKHIKRSVLVFYQGAGLSRHFNQLRLYSLCGQKLGINRFDTAVIRAYASNEKLLDKRVIGMPNDTLEYKDNKLYINGVYYEEPFLGDVTTPDMKVVLGENEYYCLGDNRNVSRDSRFYGPFDGGQIVSTHLMIIYPFSRFGFNK